MGDLKLRDPQPGDLGWVVHRNGVLYAREYGWNIEFEAHVAGIVSDFAKSFDSSRERCWMAELDGRVVGSVFIAKHDDDVAKLRMLYVEPDARGRGVGRRLVDEAISFAQLAGYREVRLWTNRELTAARKIYEAVGFKLLEEHSEPAFGVEFHSQTWRLPFQL